MNEWSVMLMILRTHETQPSLIAASEIVLARGFYSQESFAQGEIALSECYDRK
jgi:hypothetical protein